ncbi:adenylate/guanylate cyclase domain-containing protein [Rarobacter incanus]|uniref:adenylate/guanylate cyclase domain-containing protein n=1 Tax=Rarobacter incanus TaxID=153494 RepID=UPI0011514939|nr:adenylate/guanylate cyclase domain-containing protein [Rarobacter incanus]
MAANPNTEDDTAHSQPLSPRDIAQAIVGQAPSLNAAELAAETGVDQSFVDNYWHALGLPVEAPDLVGFTELDAQAIAEISAAACAHQWDEPTVSTLVRSVGHTMDRLALWQIEALVDHVARQNDIPGSAARLEVVRNLPALVHVLQTQVVHAWRLQFAAWAQRYSVEFSDTRGGAAQLDASEVELPLPRAVGFIDIVQFTERTTHLRASELADLVQTFESVTRNLITANGGRVVKTIGDAFLFIADDAREGANIALALRDYWSAHGTAVSDEPMAVRISLVWGRVLSRFGDVFGPSVNLASRLVSIAQPGRVYIDEATVTALRPFGKFTTVRHEPKSVTGLGLITPWELDRTGA